MTIQKAIQSVIDKQDLDEQTMQNVMTDIMTGQCHPIQIAGFLVGMRSKGETVTELTTATRVMRQLSVPVKVAQSFLIDTCGTGGDGSNTFNISTTAAFVVAAAGGKVAKHGNRSISSKSGSADVLKIAGIELNITAEQIVQCIEQLGIGFMFAPLHHSAMKYAAEPRRELGIKTIFNLLGPLTNPANAKRQLIGVFSRDWLYPLAQVLKNLASEQIMLVHAEDGMDEISTTATTHVVELKNGQITSYTIKPEQFGIQRTDINTLTADTIEDSLALMNMVLDNQYGPCRDIVILNAGAAIYTAGITDSLADGINCAKLAIENGSAKAKLNSLVKLTQSFSQ